MVSHLRLQQHLLRQEETHRKPTGGRDHCHGHLGPVTGFLLEEPMCRIRPQVGYDTYEVGSTLSRKWLYSAK